MEVLMPDPYWDDAARKSRENWARGKGNGLYDMWFTAPKRCPSCGKKRKDEDTPCPCWEKKRR
jgi:hypothetical protein